MYADPTYRNEAHGREHPVLVTITRPNEASVYWKRASVKIVAGTQEQMIARVKRHIGEWKADAYWDFTAVVLYDATGEPTLTLLHLDEDNRLRYDRTAPEDYVAEVLTNFTAWTQHLGLVLETAPAVKGPAPAAPPEPEPVPAPEPVYAPMLPVRRHPLAGLALPKLRILGRNY